MTMHLPIGWTLNLLEILLLYISVFTLDTGVSVTHIQRSLSQSKKAQNQICMLLKTLFHFSYSVIQNYSFRMDPFSLKKKKLFSFVED